MNTLYIISQATIYVHAYIYEYEQGKERKKNIYIYISNETFVATKMCSFVLSHPMEQRALITNLGNDDTGEGMHLAGQLVPSWGKTDAMATPGCIELHKGHSSTDDCRKIVRN